MPSVRVYGLTKNDKLKEIRKAIRKVVSTHLETGKDRVSVYLIADLLPDPKNFVTIRVSPAKMPKRTFQVLEGMNSAVAKAAKGLCPTRATISWTVTFDETKSPKALHEAAENSDD